MHVARVVVHAASGLMLVLIARVIVVIFIKSFRSQFSVLGGILFTLLQSVIISLKFVLSNLRLTVSENLLPLSVPERVLVSRFSVFFL